ncbi:MULTISPECIES: LysR family transcriptional regulator [Rhodopseudomonas]|uniref:LysR family transcriptional regulator n=1 Tax=Rhodopseudomonas palustris TaxID=1076 RepID=A0A0D7F742_RHOPL|nr:MULTISPECIES: LysR family transcriptional regulator [Rhodopseudomonas]KIZ47537.1 LysR family transcriptional regulator [Rhodopseudomonas palustris]MDF3811698.1 LysR family transcriptional regulator [Rhodopseudomonas sp. BAL398]WOK17913.1 LysR family transcriptional regulator [Rhodopseudomonas sp. BAL398]
MDGAEFSQLKAFVAVCDELAFGRAAKRLAMSPSALSRIVRALESRLGIRLLNRTTRSVGLTEAGSILYDRIKPMMMGMDEAVSAVGAYQSEPKGVVRINLPSIAAQIAVLPRLQQFRLAYPEVRLDLVIDNDITDVVAEGFDAGVRIGGQISRDMIAVRITRDLRMAVVGAPSYFANRQLPQAPVNLKDHFCLTYKWKSTGVLYPWRFEGADGVVDVDVENVMTVNDTELLLSAARQGVGLAYLIEDLVEPFVEKNELMRVLEPFCKVFPGFYLYYPERSHMAASVRAFIDFMKVRGF